MMQLNTYLAFDGEAEAAMSFYQTILGGEFVDVLRYKDMPTDLASDIEIDEQQADRIMHMSLAINESNMLLANDSYPSMGAPLVKGTQYAICIQPDSEDEARRIYEQLSEGGEIEMALEVQFWGGLFASFKDKFGIAWLIDYPM